LFAGIPRKVFWLPSDPLHVEHKNCIEHRDQQQRDKPCHSKSAFERKWEECEDARWLDSGIHRPASLFRQRSAVDIPAQGYSEDLSVWIQSANSQRRGDPSSPKDFRREDSGSGILLFPSLKAPTGVPLIAVAN
jgi:hypothetical protein